MNISLREKEDFHDKHLVLGTAGLGGVWSDVDLKKSVYALEYALDNGVGVVDTAPAYNQAQEVLAKAIKNRKNNLPIISSKIGRLRGENSDTANYDYSSSGMAKSVEDTLKLLSIDSLDILFLHDPDAIENIAELDRIMENMISFKEKGYTKEIGLGGNFKNPKFYDYLNQNYFTVFQGYNRLNPLTTVAMDEEFGHCIKNDVMVYAASPLFMGLLGRRLNVYRKELPDWLPEWALNKAIEFEKLCEKYAEDMPSLAHRFLFSIEEIDRVVVGASKLEQLKHTIDTWNKGPMSKEDFSEIKEFAST